MGIKGTEEGEKGPSRRKTYWFKDRKGRMKFRKEKLEGIWMVLRQKKTANNNSNSILKGIWKMNWDLIEELRNWK